MFYDTDKIDYSLSLSDISCRFIKMLPTIQTKNDPLSRDSTETNLLSVQRSKGSIWPTLIFNEINNNYVTSILTTTDDVNNDILNLMKTVLIKKKRNDCAKRKVRRSEIETINDRSSSVELVG